MIKEGKIHYKKIMHFPWTFPMNSNFLTTALHFGGIFRRKRRAWRVLLVRFSRIHFPGKWAWEMHVDRWKFLSALGDRLKRLSRCISHEAFPPNCFAVKFLNVEAPTAIAAVQYIIIYTFTIHSSSHSSSVSIFFFL
jgi:hypothetical protein